jgi:putative methionine-R-sulfoxide reductase with GAF domain
MTEAETLARIGAASGASRAEAMQEVADAIRAHGGYRWVGLYDVSATEVAIVVWSGGGPPAYPTFPRTQGLTSRAIATGETVVADDVQSDPDYLEAFGDTRAEAIVPVVIDGEVVGTIDVESGEPNALGDADRLFLERCRDAARTLWS